MKPRSPLPRSQKPILRRVRPRKVNPKRQAKRKAGYRKMLSGKEYKAARAEAMKRADGQCEFVTNVHGDPKYPAWVTRVVRCDTFFPEDPHAHHLSYPKSRPLEASDLLIVCTYHHEYLESLKPHKQRMF